MHAPHRQLSLIAPANHLKYAYKVSRGIVEILCLVLHFSTARH